MLTRCKKRKNVLKNVFFTSVPAVFDQKSKPATAAQQQQQPQTLKPQSTGVGGETGRPSPADESPKASAAIDVVGSPMSADQSNPPLGVDDEEEHR